MSDSTIELKTGFDFSFPIFFSRNIFSTKNSPLTDILVNASPQSRFIVFLEESVSRHFPQLEQEIESKIHHCNKELTRPPIILPGGEQIKDGFSDITSIMEILATDTLCRQSYVFAIGGGAFLDAVGLACSLTHRGLRLVRMPTTALSQGDSGVGVKTGVNMFGQKNFAGTFAPPYAVINDLSFLDSLPKNLILDGVAEAIKVALIKDAEFFNYINDHATAIANCEQQVTSEIIIKSATLHAKHIATSGDPFEMGNARPLDFGHWLAHQLEIDSDHTIRHGQGVALGIALDSYIACSLNLLTKNELKKITDCLRGCGFELWHDLLDNTQAVISGVENFRQHLGGELCLAMPSGIGQLTEINKLDENVIINATTSMKSDMA